MILSGDFYFLADQARDYLLVKDIIYNNHIQLIGTHSGLGGFFHGPLWLYMLVPVFLLGGGNPIFFAYFYIILALVTVFTGFIVGKKLYNDWIGLLIAFILAISPTIWSYVPNTIGISVVPLVYLGIFYFFIKFVRGDNTSLVFASFFVGTTLQFETAAALVLIPVFALAVLIFRFYIIKNFKIIGLSIISFMLSLAWYILFDLKNSFLMTKALLGLGYSDGHKQEGYMYFPERFFSHMDSLYGSVASVVFTKNIFLLLILVALFLYGLWYVMDRKQQIKELLALLFMPLLIFIIFFLYPFPIYHDYILGFTIPFALIIGLIAFNIWNQVVGKALIILFIAVNFGFAVAYINQQYRAELTDTTPGSYKNQLHVVDSVFRDAQGKEFGYFVYTAETFTYGMDYLMWWRGKQQGYIPESKKMNNTYLILYPSFRNEESGHAFWIENVINSSSKPVKTVSFPSGITVQKHNMVNDQTAESPHYHQNLIFR